MENRNGIVGFLEEESLGTWELEVPVGGAEEGEGVDGFLLPSCCWACAPRSAVPVTWVGGGHSTQSSVLANANLPAPSTEPSSMAEFPPSSLSPTPMSREGRASKASKLGQRPESPLVEEDN